MKIAFLLGTFSSGGAERVASLLINALQTRGHQVSLLTWGGIEKDFYRLHDGVRRIGMNLLGARAGIAKVGANLRRIARLREEIRRHSPDVVISFITQTNVLALIAVAGLRIPVVISERIDPRVHPEPFPWRLLRSCVYRRACRLVVQTDAVRGWAERLVGSDRVVVIPNPVGEYSLHVAVPRPETDRPLRIIAMGRLVHQKGFDLLLDAFHLAAKQIPACRLAIYGEGPDRGLLERRARERGLAEHVSFPGVVANPADALCDATLFVLSSRYEGFPNALIEAMSLGCPVVAFDCPSGPAEIVRHEVDGLLVPSGDVQALSAAISRVLLDPDLRSRLARRAVDVRHRFSLDSVVNVWQVVLRQAIDNAAK